MENGDVSKKKLATRNSEWKPTLTRHNNAAVGGVYIDSVKAKLWGALKEWTKQGWMCSLMDNVVAVDVWV